MIFAAVNIYRSSHQTCPIKIGVLKKFTKVTGKHLCQNTSGRLLLYILCSNSTNKFFHNTRLSRFYFYNISLLWIFSDIFSYSFDLFICSRKQWVICQFSITLSLKIMSNILLLFCFLDPKASTCKTKKKLCLSLFKSRLRSSDIQIL